MMNKATFSLLAASIMWACILEDAEAQRSLRDATRDFPSRPIRLVVPYAPGGGSDITARSIAHVLSEQLAQQVIVDNRPGAAGNIGTKLAARATPDGYTLLAISASHAVLPALNSKLPYDLLKDFAPISETTRSPSVLVLNPAVAAKSVKELIALSKSTVKALTYGSPGTGSLAHLAGALLISSTSANLLHVPYKGGAPAVLDVIGGQIDMTFSTLLQSTRHIKSGSLRALAVTAKTRSKALPDVPTMIEAGVPDYDVNQWNALVTTAGTPAAIVDRLSSEIQKVVQTPELRERLSADGSDPVGSTPEALRARISADIAKWKMLVKKANIRLN